MGTFKGLNAVACSRWDSRNLRYTLKGLDPHSQRELHAMISEIIIGSSSNMQADSYRWPLFFLNNQIL